MDQKPLLFIKFSAISQLLCFSHFTIIALLWALVFTINCFCTVRNRPGFLRHDKMKLETSFNIREGLTSEFRISGWETVLPKHFATASEAFNSVFEQKDTENLNSWQMCLGMQLIYWSAPKKDFSFVFLVSLSSYTEFLHFGKVSSFQTISSICQLAVFHQSGKGFS